MGQPQPLQPGFFQAIRNRPSQLAETGVAGTDVVDAWSDDGPLQPTTGEAVRKRLEAATGAGAGVRNKSVTSDVGQVVHQRNVTEDEAATKIDAVRLDRVEAIGREDEHSAAGP